LFSEEDPDLMIEFNGQVLTKNGEAKSRYDRDEKKPDDVKIF